MLFANITGLRVRPAKSNSPVLRQAALRNRLSRRLGERPALLISNRCPVLRRALASGYRRMPKGRGGSYYDTVDKNEFSHVAEAAEYHCLGHDGMDEALERRTGSSFQARPVVAPHEFGVV